MKIFDYNFSSRIKYQKLSLSRIKYWRMFKSVSEKCRISVSRIIELYSKFSKNALNTLWNLSQATTWWGDLASSTCSAMRRLVTPSPRCHLTFLHAIFVAFDDVLWASRNDSEWAHDYLVEMRWILWTLPGFAAFSNAFWARRSDSVMRRNVTWSPNWDTP